jgi:tripartite-type tricarboxylate transporter receptor subunit TctC
MVNSDFQAKTLDKFIEIAKDKKIQINYGSSGAGASNHLAGVLFNKMTGGEMVHVPYKGGSLANNDLMGVKFRQCLPHWLKYWVSLKTENFVL